MAAAESITQNGHIPSGWYPLFFLSNAHPRPSLAWWNHPRERGCRHSGVPRAGAKVWGTDQAPRGAAVSQTPFGGFPERPGQGGQCPDLSTNRAGSWHWSAFLSAQPSMGGWRGGTLPGDWTPAGPAAPSPTRWVTAGRAPSVPQPVAGCPRPSCTMSDGEGPSAGEWQRYIYPGQVRLQSQGHGSHGALPPHPGCRRCGLDPLPPSLMSGGLCSWRGS